MDFWGWFNKAKKEVSSSEFDSLTDGLTDEDIQKAEDFFKVNGRERTANFRAFLDMLTRN